MKIDKDILLECICHLCKYQFSDIKDYQVHDEYILATVISESDKVEYFVGQKNVDIDIDEYLNYVRCKKLDIINKKLHT